MMLGPILFHLHMTRNITDKSIEAQEYTEQNVLHQDPEQEPGQVGGEPGNLGPTLQVKGQQAAVRQNTQHT